MFIVGMSEANQAQADTTPEEAGAENAPENTDAPQYGDEIAKIESTEELENFLEKARQPAQQQPAADEEPEAEEPEAEAEEPGEEPAEEEPEEEEEPEAEEPEEEPEPERDDSSIRMRFRPKTDVDKRALELMKNNRDLSLEECFERARKELGQEESKPTPASEEQPAVETSESLTKKIQELKAEKRRAATEELDMERAFEIDDELDELRDKLSEAKVREATAQKEEQEKANTEFDTQWGQAEARALDLYDFVNDPESPGSKLMADIDARLEAEDDPLFNDPRKPLKLAQMAAAELNIPPKSKRPAKPAPPSKPVRKSRPVVQPASGGARTQNKTPAAGLQQRINSVDSLEDLDDLNQELGISGF